jgi:conjugative transfer region lipoprotein (TIGR03751 family)
MPYLSIRTAALVLTSTLLLAACAGNKDSVLPQDGQSMKQIYEEHFERIGRQRLDRVRGEEPKRGIKAGDTDLSGYLRDAQDEIRAVFPRLPNPALVMFVFPHLAGPDGVPVPGYATSFPMYESVEYALPGEVPESSAE